MCRRHSPNGCISDRNTDVDGLHASLVEGFGDGFVAGSAHADYAVALGIPRARVVVGCDVVDNAYWSSRAQAIRADGATWRARLQLPERYFIAVSRFIPKKNLDGLLKAYALYRQDVGERAWHLVMCGAGKLGRELRELATRLQVHDIVHFSGYLDAEQLSAHYALASAFVQASAYDEQWGLVVNEAMAAGLPVLVSRNVGCAPELVRAGVNGYTFDPFRLYSLADRMKQLTSMTQTQLDQCGAASRTLIADWSPERFAQNLLAIATTTIEERRRSCAS